jgi:hypothetical protein
MRTTTIAIAALAFTAGFPASTTPSDAAHRTVRVCDSNSGVYRCYLKKYDPSDEATRIRAKNLDPAGDYKGYPAWAQYALSPKSDGGNHRR